MALGSGRERFRDGNAYRAAREWQRYEGTAQRDLFRTLRARFLARHAVPARWVLDAGSGPGRFTRSLGTGVGVRRIALDIGGEMLRAVAGHRADPGEPLPDRVRADAARPPFVAGAFDLVAALGNLLGFVEDESDRLFSELCALVAPGGTLLWELAPGPGERSRYLHRLPPGSVARLLRSAPGLVSARVLREGFVPEPRRRTAPGEFRRVSADALAARLTSMGFRVEEVLAVAPGLGPDPVRLAAIARDAKAWSHVLEVEESLGRSPDRWPAAAAVLIAASAPGGGTARTGPDRPQSEG